MWSSKIRLRMSVEKNKLKSEGLKRGSDQYRRAIHEKHALSFFFIGMSLNLNLDTSLLTEKLFKVENFTNVTVFLYFGTVIIVVILYMFLIPYKFHQLVGAAWLLFLSRVCQLLAAAFCRGVSGRNIFLLLYTFNGFLRGVISLTSNYVISKYFLNTCYLHVVNGGVFFSILVSLLQMACDAVLGTDVDAHIRMSLVIGQVFYLLETSIAAIWITIVYLTYDQKIIPNDLDVADKKSEKSKDNCESTAGGSGTSSSHSAQGPDGSRTGVGEKCDFNYSELGNKHQKAWQKFGYVPYYPSKFIIVVMSSLFRVIFHPVMVPYMMDIEYISKLIASICFTCFEFLGRVAALSVEEYIDESKRAKSVSHESFLFQEDTIFYLLFCYQAVICSLCIYSTWFQRLGISKNPYFITFVTMSSGFVAGYNDNRGKEGAQSVIKYYARLSTKSSSSSGSAGSSNGDNKNIIDDKVASDTSNVNDILTLFDYLSFTCGCIISYLFQLAITRHKKTYDFIIIAHRKFLDVDSVDTLLSLF